VATIFDKLNERRPPSSPSPALPPLETITRRARKNGELKAFLLDVLVNGPAPATLVYERGQAHGFSRMQVRHAQRKMNVISFKETGRNHGRWFWALPPLVPAPYLTNGTAALARTRST
jgi:hypothetical protein